MTDGCLKMAFKTIHSLEINFINFIVCFPLIMLWCVLILEGCQWPLARSIRVLTYLILLKQKWSMSSSKYFVFSCLQTYTPSIPSTQNSLTALLCLSKLPYSKDKFKTYTYSPKCLPSLEFPHPWHLVTKMSYIVTSLFTHVCLYLFFTVILPIT